jgi:rsbT co-antagonist protein RsbR
MTDLALDFTVTFIFVICNVALATFVAVRAWDHRPARVFVIVVALLIGTGIVIFGQAIFLKPDELYVLHAIHLIQVGMLSPAFVALLSAMFMPIWWQGRRPIIWILLPYLFFCALISADLLARLGIFVTGIKITATDTTFDTTNLGRVLLIVFSLSWAVQLGVLITAFIRDPQSRLPIIALGGSIVVSLFLNSIRLVLSPSPVQRGLILLTPIPIALAYAVFRTRLITPLRVAIDHAFEAMSDMAIVLNNTEQITYANARASGLGFLPQVDFSDALQTINANLDTTAVAQTGMPQRLEVADRRLMVSLNVLSDKYGQRLGMLVLGRDVTDIEERTIQLEEERAHLARLVIDLETEQRERAALAATVQSMALPVIPILDGVLVLPLVGVFDTERINDLRTQLLTAIERQRAHMVILDLTGLSFIDAMGASGLTASIQGARLLGTQCVLVGVRPEIAEAIVAQNLDIGDTPTAPTLQEAVNRALVRTKMAVAR